MRRQITPIIFTFLAFVCYGQKTILLRPFIDDHKVFSYKDKYIGFMNLDKYDKAWQFTIDQFDSKTITVKQISDSLINNCNDSIALTVLKSWFRLCVDSILINHTDNYYNITIGINNTYNEDKSGVFGTIYFKVILLYDNKSNNKQVRSINYLTMTKKD